MKKVFLFIAAATVALVACKKEEYVIPTDNDNEQQEQGNTDDEGYKEKTFTVNVVLKDGVNTNYDGVVASMPGKEILDFFDMTAEEFYAGMGKFKGDTDGSEGDMSAISQVDNTIYFGVANGNDTDNLKWIPRTGGNVGHWFTADGTITYWADEASLFDIESAVEWGLDAPDAETLDAMWDFNCLFHVGHYTSAVGKTYTATQVFFYTDDDDVELYAYVKWNLTIEEAEQVKLNVVGSETLELSAPYDDKYTHTALDFNADAVQSAIGISFEDADVYGVNADGSFSLAPGVNFWFSVGGDIIGWQSEGGKNGICINSNETGEWAWCMYPYDGLVGQTLKGGIAFVNPSTLNAYVVNVTVTVNEQDTWKEEVTVMLIDEYVETYPDVTGIANFLGYEDVDGLYDALCSGDVYPVGINADGSQYLNEDGTPFYSQTTWDDEEWGSARGIFFSKEGNCTTWNSGTDHFYTTMYWFVDQIKTVEIDFSPLAVTAEDLGEYTFVWGFTDGEKVAYLEYSVTLDNLDFDTTEAGTIDISVSQTVAAAYGGESFTLDAATIALLGEGDYYLVDKNGGVDYTANGGFWFNADGEVSPYSDGAFFVEPAEDEYTFNTGIHPGNVTAAGEYTTTFRIANPAVGAAKHITVNLKLTVTE